MDRRVLFFEPVPTGELNALGNPEFGPPKVYEVWCTRRDRGGSEGFVTDAHVGGTWSREYECWAEAFPFGRRPDERWKLEADDGIRMRIESIDEVNSDTHPVMLRIRAYRSQERVR